MSAPDWTAIATRFHAAAARLTAPNWWRRVGGVANRLTPRICPRCGGDGLHRLPCERAHRSIDPRIQFGNAVIRAERRLAARRALREMLATLAADVAARGLVLVGGKWVLP